jgi:hypothetical protein
MNIVLKHEEVVCKVFNNNIVLVNSESKRRYFCKRNWICKETRRNH